MRPNDVPDNDVPDVAGVRDEVSRALVTLVRVLRRAGVSVPANAAVVGARSLVEVGLDDEDRARAGLRAALLTRPDDIDTFDRLFAEFWEQLDVRLDTEDRDGTGDDVPDNPISSPDDDDPSSSEVAAKEVEDNQSVTEPHSEEGSSVVTSALEPGPGEDDDREAKTTATYSPAGQSETVTVDLGSLVDDKSLDTAIDRLVAALATVRGRRWTRAPTGQRADARRALRQSVATGGAIVSIPERTQPASTVQTLLLVDVSRSVLDTVDRTFVLRFLQILAGLVQDARIFFFDSEVREVTRAFDSPTTADAVRALERAETHWGGGTRIGHALETVRREHPESVDRRTVLFVVSDGLEMGNVADLETEMTWFSRQSRAVLWLNPLAASPAYRPTVAGMAAALPFVDGLFGFTDTEDVVELARQLEQYGTGGRIGFEHDPRRIAEARDGSSG